MPAIFIDANPPIYASGKPHPLKIPSAGIIQLVSENAEAFVTSVEVMQEFLHYCRVRRVWRESRFAYYALRQILEGRIEPVHVSDIDRAAETAQEYPRLGARDLIHLAVMRRLGVTRIVSADRGFDLVPEVERLDPARFREWRATLV